MITTNITTTITGNIVTAFLIMSGRGFFSYGGSRDSIKERPVENIFRITDEIVHQLNNKK
jgi:hypothetical protein